MNSFSKSLIFKKHSNPNKENISYGFPEIDRVLSNTLKPGSIVLVEEDEYSSYHQIFLKSFLTQGIISKDKNVIISKDHKKINLPEAAIKEHQEEEGEKMYIAWRYSNLTLKEDYGEIDFSKNMDLEKVKNIEIILNENLNFEDTLKIIERLESRTRVGLFSLLSPLWLFNGSTKMDKFHIYEFLFKLKKIVKKTGVVLITSIPMFLNLGISIYSYFDVIFKIDSHLLDNICSNYKGIIEFKKISTDGMLRINDLDTFKFGFKWKRRSFLIEKIVVPPEENEPSRECNITNKF